MSANEKISVAACPLEHVSAATVQRLVREREDALHEVQVLDAENERLRDELGKARAAVFDECAAFADSEFKHWQHRVDLGGRGRADEAQALAGYFRQMSKKARGPT